MKKMYMFRTIKLSFWSIIFGKNIHWTSKQKISTKCQKKKSIKKHASYNLLTIKDIRLRKKNVKTRKKWKKKSCVENATK